MIGLELRMVSSIAVELVRDPEVPIATRGYVPATTLLLALRLNELVELVLGGLKVALTPAGSPETARLTLPSKSPPPTTLMVLDAVVPGETESAPAEEERLKLGVRTVSAIEVVFVRLSEVPVTVTV